jgi:MarR family transcriptional regulator, temperature-dependent positive regulator of motility
MKKAAIVLLSLMFLLVFNVKTSEAAYLPEYDKYVEVSYEEARYIADLMGLQGYELGEETARMSFEMQERLIIKIEKVLKTEIDHYYIWLTVDGETVLGIDPPHPMF